MAAHFYEKENEERSREGKEGWFSTLWIDLALIIDSFRLLMDACF